MSQFLVRSRLARTFDVVPHSRYPLGLAHGPKKQDSERCLCRGTVAARSELLRNIYGKNPESLSPDDWSSRYSYLFNFSSLKSWEKGHRLELEHIVRRQSQGDIADKLKDAFKISLAHGSCRLAGYKLRRVDSSTIYRALREQPSTVNLFDNPPPLSAFVQADSTLQDYPQDVLKIRNNIIAQDYAFEKININETETTSGEYRVLSSPTAVCALPHEIASNLDRLIASLRQQCHHPLYNPVLFGAQFLASFFAIHPFHDGNARVGRLLMDMFLLHHRYYPIVFGGLNQAEYIDGLHRLCFDNEPNKWFALVFESVRKSMVPLY